MRVGLFQAGTAFYGWLFCCLGPLVAGAEAQVTAPHLQIERTGTNLPVWLSSSSQSNSIVWLQSSTNLRSWETIATCHTGLLDYPDLREPRGHGSFYRLSAGTRGPNDDWKNQVSFPIEPFRSTNNDAGVGWVKFAILLREPWRVYYEDSKKFVFHYDFAAQRLAPFRGMSYSDFAAVSLHLANQQIVLGTLLYPPTSSDLFFMGGIAECGIQFDGLDPYSPGEIAGWMELVKATVFSSNRVSAYYMPSFEQSEMARTNSEAFAARGIAISSVDRWGLAGNCYVTGWALGRLNYLPAGETVAAFGEGRLRPEDILLTDGVPADTPLVAGIVSLSPATPNSHTAILCQSFGVPFVYLPQPEERARAQQLAGHKVILRATTSFSGDQARIIDIENGLPGALESDLLALKKPAPIQISPKQTRGAFWASCENLTPADIRYYGGKAANFGFLRRSVPTNSPVALAFSFDLWDAFIDQTLTNGQTLRAQIASRLRPYTNYRPNMVALKADLSDVRALITKTASFSPALKQVVLDALSSFTPGRKLRFRSSTNVEDSEHFAGAGLYDSYSGCLADDLDGDDQGPSQCDPSEPDERGVFRAMQKVYAGFYNDDAFLERLLYGVDENQVAMGILVHHSFPDEDELANGVATPSYNFNTQNATGNMVTQHGANSVTNPDGSALPEIVRFSGWMSAFDLSAKQSSSLLPLGAAVLAWPSEYRRFLNLFGSVADRFHSYYPGRDKLDLDFEYKKDRNLGLVLKQVRQVPPASTPAPAAPFLIDDPIAYEISQAGSVFGVHRAKSLWTLHSPSLRLTSTNLGTSLYPGGSLEYIENGSRQTLKGPIASWPNASLDSSGTIATWRTGAGTNAWTWTMQTLLQTTLGSSQSPIVTLADFNKDITLTYATPMPRIMWGTVTNTLSDWVRLQPQSSSNGSVLAQKRLFVRTNVLAVDTTYYWPKPAGGVLPLFTALLRFESTQISGLTTEPIVLTNYYSQSYGAFNHNYFEEFLFEPRLEPGLPASTLTELNAANIQCIYVYSTAGVGRLFYVIGFGQSCRQL